MQPSRLGATSMSVLKAVVAAASFFSSVAFFCNKRCCVAREQAPGNVCPLPRALLPGASGLSGRRRGGGGGGGMGASGGGGGGGGFSAAVAGPAYGQSAADMRSLIELPRRRSSFFCHYSPSQVGTRVSPIPGLPCPAYPRLLPTPPVPFQLGQPSSSHNSLPTTLLLLSPLFVKPASPTPPLLPSPPLSSPPLPSPPLSHAPPILSPRRRRSASRR